MPYGIDYKRINTNWNLLVVKPVRAGLFASYLGWFLNRQLSVGLKPDILSRKSMDDRVSEMKSFYTVHPPPKSPVIHDILLNLYHTMLNISN